jgi:hypothetical protein
MTVDRAHHHAIQRADHRRRGIDLRGSRIIVTGSASGIAATFNVPDTWTSGVKRAVSRHSARVIRAPLRGHRTGPTACSANCVRKAWRF